MTASGGHIRELNDAGKALKEAVTLYKDIMEKGMFSKDAKALTQAIQAEHLALTSVAFLKAVVERGVRPGCGSLLRITYSTPILSHNSCLSGVLPSSFTMISSVT